MITEKQFRVMKEYLRKRDSHSFKRFVDIRREIISSLVSEMKLWISSKEIQEIEKKIIARFSKENFNSSVILDLELLCSSRNKESAFKAYF